MELECGSLDASIDSHVLPRTLTEMFIGMVMSPFRELYKRVRNHRLILDYIKLG